MNPSDYLRRNRDVYNQMAAAGDPLCRVASDDELANPLKTVDGAGWLGKSIAGKRVLCLAAGGGRQSSLYAAAGADVTVVDISGSMLELDRRAAAERGFSLRVFETTMEDLGMFGVGEFDIVIQPVSTCYVPSITKVYQQVARVTSPRGIYVSQHKTPASLQSSLERNREGHYAIEHVYYRDSPEPVPVPAPRVTNRASKRLRETGAVEYLHRWEQIIGGMCHAGFVIEDLSEPLHAVPKSEHGSFGDRACYIAPYVRIKARRNGEVAASANTSGLWTPQNF
ncbi:bifunctional 3-demethylubiquinone-9 3-methyltransferase/ 2-octaprenyl-6-hydroxy phenol methylase [Rubripirellula amarantea]|uniref:Bifunctional 3-demethylubiquinone-9 3-methyltransferase/ 2-octaprenyl-6-hydroxy phenol methylase n=1 Tax=Rubripirellula amarantea TaxID=2527999 RepID=A0A5C5WHV5_9BACT|nr:class I SAM-dependent methyltransferase [Rubripirellula amarantea]TWT50378.1 bifunctional 3-demethylubiquinone-9 3-methyltransferase/ 2-octaprenyl-6-hydroxy phenol methylase [Rubripirellula amarantea]